RQRGCSMSTVQTWVADFAAREQGLAGADIPWLAATRKRAIERFASEGWPTTKQEGWRHTSLAALEQLAFVPAGQVDVAEKVRQIRANEPGHWLVFVDGRFDSSLSDIGDLPDGAQVQALSLALADSPDAVQALLGNEAQGASPTALNLAMAGEGAVVRLARGVALDKPVHLVFIAASPQAATFTRNLIQADAGSRAVVVEHYLGYGS